MPNHVSHKVTFRYGEDDYEEKKAMFDEVLTFMKSEDWPFDFNRLIPYPEKYAKADKAAKEYSENGGKWEDRPENGFNHGGYEWCLGNWGTKWNAYTACVGYDEVTFQTAWNYPEPIFKALSKKFPDLIFEVEYADEDSGSNCGITAWKNGVEIERRDNKTDPGYPWYWFAKRLYYQTELNAERKENEELREKLKVTN